MAQRGDLLAGKIALEQKHQRFVRPLFLAVIPKRATGFFTEGLGQMFAGDAEFPRQPGRGQRFVERFLDLGLNVQNPQTVLRQFEFLLRRLAELTEQRKDHLRRFQWRQKQCGSCVLAVGKQFFFQSAFGSDVEVIAVSAVDLRDDAAGGFAPEIDPHKTPFLTAVPREIVGYARIAVTVEERGSGRAVVFFFADLQYASTPQRYGDLPADLKRDQSVRKLRDAVSLFLHLFHDDVRVRHLLELNILFYSGYRVGHYRETISRERYISEIIWKANGALMQSGQHLHEIRRCSLGTGMFSCDLIYGSQ